MAKAKPPIENKIYMAIIGICEGREASGAYKGNGHHLAQELTKAVSAGILAPKNKKIYNALTTVPTPTKEIAKILSSSSKTVSSALLQMEKNTLLVLSNRKGKLRLWYKS